MGAEGFIVAHKTRLAVFTEIVAGEHDAKRIAKKHHLVSPAVESALKEMVAQGILKKGAKGYSLTAEGDRAADALRKGHLM